MTTNDAALTFAISLPAEKSAHKTPWMTLLAIPTAMCLLSIVLAFQSPAFASAVALLGLQ